MDAAVAVAPTVIATGVALPGAGARASNSPPAAADASLPTTSTLTPSSEVVVHVAGLVRRPGLVRLPSGSRVADAVAAAGGVTRTRAADSVNLARVLVDGEQIVVGSGVAASGTGTAPATAGPTDLNTADATALELLPGIGPVLAGRIIAWRTANGPFRSIDELGEVSGIGDAILALLRPVVRV
jgi:competence protein ComEA